MTSPALRHRQKVLAAHAAPASQRTAVAAPAPEGPVDPAARNEQAALVAVLHENLRTLADIASHEQRQPKKLDYARQFRPWIDGLLQADQPVQDEVLVTNFIWALDYRDFDFALQLARFILAHGLALPERFSRTPACYLAEEVATVALTMHAEVPHEVLLDVSQLVEGADMPDQVAAKLKKATGRSWLKRAEDFDPAADNAPAGGALAYVEQALADLQRALGLDAQAGVKKDIQRAESLQKKLTANAGEQQ